MSVVEDRKEFNIKCLGINISAQTIEGIPFNIVVKNIDPDAQVKIGVEKGFDYFFPPGFLNANRMPLRSHEDLCVFYQSPPVYNPQKTIGAKNHSKGSMQKNTNHNYGEFKAQESDQSGLKHPTSILRFPKPHPSTAVHPTQKPVELLEYLIRTYTDPFSTVLDNCMGSGSTGVAAISQNRHFIGFELDKEYFEIAKTRIEKAKEELHITAL